MSRRLRLLAALFALTSVVTGGCTPEVVRLTPSPTVAPTSAAPNATATATRTATAAPTTSAPTATPTPAPTTSPGSTPPTACPTLTGGSAANRALLTAVRVAHNPGFDRVVFEFSPSSGPGAYGTPPYAIEVANSFAGPSGLPVHVDGNAFFRVRFQNTDAHNDSGVQTISSSDIHPATPLVREVRLVEDFEAVVVWGIGLDRLACPAILTLAGPVRVVLDFPTPP